MRGARRYAVPGAVCGAPAGHRTAGHRTAGRAAAAAARIRRPLPQRAGSSSLSIAARSRNVETSRWNASDQ